MIENIQIYIDNIHIRYEDDRIPGSPYACGLTVESATACSTDEKYEDTEFRSRKDEPCVHKVCEFPSPNIHSRVLILTKNFYSWFRCKIVLSIGIPMRLRWCIRII